MPATLFNLPSTPRTWAAYALLMAVLTWACFGNLRFHLLETHDFETFRDNAKVSADFGYFFSPEKEQASGRLLHEFAMWLFHLAFGPDPAAFHLLVVALHFLASLLLAYLFVRAGADIELGLLGGLLFLLNVAHFRAIHWLSGFNYILAFALALAAVLSYLRYGDTQRPHWLAACYASLILGAFSHLASLMAWPFCCYLAWLRGHSPRRAARELIPFAALLAPALALILHFTAKRTSTWEALDFFSVAGLWELIAGILRSTLFLAGRLLTTAHWLTWPQHQRASWEYAAGALVVAALALIIWRRPAPAALWAGWTLFFLVPFVLLTEESIVALPVGPSRYLYFPSAGTALLMAWGLRRGAHALPGGRQLALALAILALAFSSYRALHRAEALTYYNSGRTYLSAADDSTGAAQLRQAMTRAPELINLEDAYVRLSMALMRHPFETVAVLEDGLARFPQNAYLQIYDLAYRSLLPGFAEQPRLEALQGHARASVALSHVYTNLGLGYEGIYQSHSDSLYLDRAIAAYQHALVFAPDHVKALKRLGAIRYKQGQAGAAAALLHQAQDADASDSGVAYAAIMALQLDGRFREAIAACEEALAARPSADLYALLGECHEEAGEPAPAQRAYRQSLALDANHVAAHRGLARLASRAGHHQTAFASLEKIIGLGQAVALDHANLGTLYFRTGNRPAAAAAYREAIRLDPHHAPTQHDLGVVLHAMGRPDEAAQALRRATELAPTDPENYFKLGSLALERGQSEAALEDLGRAVELGIDHVYAHLFLGRLYQEKGRTDEALGLYERILTGALHGTDDRVRAQVKTYLAQADTDAARRLLDAHWPRD